VPPGHSPGTESQVLREEQRFQREIPS
jgi:hypothetical protein